MRLAGIDLPDDKRIDYTLTKIYGVGWPLSLEILKKAEVLPETRSGKLSEKDLASLAHVLEDYTTEGELRRLVLQNIQRLRDIGSYRGSRHSKGLPARGQRTRTNARTKRGKRKTVGAFKKEMLAKTGTPTPGKVEEQASKKVEVKT